MLSLDLRSMTYLGLMLEHRNRANTLFRMLHIEFYSFSLGKVDEIKLTVCRTTKVRVCHELLRFIDEVNAFR
jgi:hypothetical protein